MSETNFGLHIYFQSDFISIKKFPSVWTGVLQKVGIRC